MRKFPVFQILLALLIYLALFVIASSCGLIHPACYACAGTFEGNLPLIVGLLVLTLLAEFIRRRNGYDTLKGVRLSFIPFAFSFYAYSAHWWTDTEGSLAAAVEEMPAGYADKMLPVIRNIPLLVIMLALTIPVAILAMRLAESVMKKQAAKLN